MKKMLITGASGFIGKNIRERLSLQYEILAPSRAELDLLDAGAVERYLDNQKLDIVIHAAVQRTLGLSEEHERQVLHNNLVMFCNLERCRDYYDKMIFLGSGAEYDKGTYLPLMKEEYFGHEVPSDDYGLSKYVMTKISESSSNIFNLRLFGVFGPYEDYNYRFISNSICKMLRGKDIVIHRNVRFDYLYIKDFCNILDKFLGIEPQFRNYNVCTGVPVDLLTIAELIQELLDTKNKIIVEKQGMGYEYSGDNSRIMQEIGEYQFMDMKRSIAELIDFYKHNDFELKGNY